MPFHPQQPFMEQQNQKGKGDEKMYSHQSHGAHTFQDNFGKEKGCGPGDDDSCQQQFTGLLVESDGFYGYHLGTGFSCQQYKPVLSLRKSSENQKYIAKKSRK